MKEINAMILQEKLKPIPDKKFIQWLQKLDEDKLKKIIINKYNKV